jgi:hypothetical protein
MEVVLSYTVHGTKIFEHPSSVATNGQVAFVRTFKIEKTKSDLALLVLDVESSSARQEHGNWILQTGNGHTTAIAAIDLPRGGRLELVDQTRLVLRLPKKTPATTFKIVLWSGGEKEIGSFSALTRLAIGKPFLADFKKGGPPRWPQQVVTRGVLETSRTPDGAYVTDSLTPPMDNPWKRRVRFGGLDFFSDGKSAALCTWDGDIWIVSGIDDRLEQLRWRRFASGMYETLGLKIVKDIIYTSGRDQITRYHDLNKDGEADFYENFNNHVTSTEGFHEFLFDLQTDAQGNFYFAKAGPVRPGGSGFEKISAHAGTLCKVSKDGRKLEVVATGFRAPNGIGVGPKGELTCGDNEGTWMPTCPVNWIKPGGFYGVEQLAHKHPVPPFNPPMLWLSRHGWDNSGGGQVWVTSSKWGPFEGELLHCSYGECALYLIMKQSVGDLMQGAAVRFPLKFTSSAMRPKFNPKDGQLYVAGLQGWQTKAVKASGLDRIRYTGKPVYSVAEMKVDQPGVHLTFTQPLDLKEASDVQNYSVRCWNYDRSEKYGSPELSVANPAKRSRDSWELKGAHVSADGKTITLELPELKPVMQMEINYEIKARDGTAIKQAIQNTIHVVPADS